MAKKNNSYNNVYPIDSAMASCGRCGLHACCFGGRLSTGEFKALDEIVKRRIALPKGAHAYRMGTAFQSIYAIRTGSLKTYTLDYSGDEQISGFHLPTELIGLDAIFASYHPSAAQALESTTLCELSYEGFLSFGFKQPGLQQRVLRIMSQELQRTAEHVMLLGKKNAKARLAVMLLRLGQRFQERGFSGREFRLSMSRSDIANHLGLSTETVSRLFTCFQKQELIAVERKQVKILKLEALVEAAGELMISPSRPATIKT
jgi:CRP/FNR family transcriptional regulator